MDGSGREIRREPFIRAGRVLWKQWPELGRIFSGINGPIASIFFTRFRAQKLRDRRTVQWAGARSEARLLHVADNSLIRSDET